MNDESTTLFLGDLSVFCTEKDIRKLFRPFGTIEAIRVKRGSSSKTNLSYGFIKFSTREAAEIALQQLSGVMFLGRALRIGWAEGKNAPKPAPVSQETKPMETAQVHVSFISKQIDVLISEATLRSLFGLYGEVVDVALKKSQFDRNLRIQNGYGFVHYPLTREGVQSAFSAVASLHQVTIDRVTYDCSVSHALEELILTPQFALSPSHAQLHMQPNAHSSHTLSQQQQQQQSLSHANSPYPSPRTHNHHKQYTHSFSHANAHPHSHTSHAHTHMPPPPSASLSSPSLSLSRAHSFSFSSAQLPPPSPLSHTHNNSNNNNTTTMPYTHTPRDVLSDVPLSLSSFNAHSQHNAHTQFWSRDPLSLSSHTSLTSHTTQQSSLYSVSPQMSPSLSSFAHKQMQFTHQQRGRTSSGNSVSSLSHFSLTPPLSERDRERDTQQQRERCERSRSASDSVESNDNNNNNNNNNTNNNTTLPHNTHTTSNNFSSNFNDNNNNSFTSYYNSNASIPSHLSSTFSANLCSERSESDGLLSLSSHHTTAGFSLSAPPSLSLPHTSHTHNPFSPVSSPHTTHPSHPHMHSFSSYSHNTHFHFTDSNSERVPQRERVLSSSSISTPSHHTAFPYTSEGERNAFFDGLSPALLGTTTQHFHTTTANGNASVAAAKSAFFFANEGERETTESESAAALLCGLSVLSLNPTTQDVSSAMNETLTF